MKIAELQKEIYANNVAKGFYEEPHETGTRLMLVVSEVSEALEADRKGHTANIQGFNKWMENVSVDVDSIRQTYDVQIFQTAFEATVKNSFEDEIADAVIRLLDIAENKNINLEWHIKHKLAYNKLRPHKHGKAY